MQRQCRGVQGVAYPSMQQNVILWVRRERYSTQPGWQIMRTRESAQAFKLRM